MARMWKPFFSNCSMMSPTAFLATASGFTMVRVRCRVFIMGRLFLDSWLLDLFWLLGTGTRYSALDLNSQRRHKRLPYGRWRFCHADAGRFHHFDLLRGCALAAGNDRPGVTHSASRRRGLPGDEADHRLLHVGLHKFRGGFFGIAADFTNHNHGFGLGIAIEQVERIHEVGSDDRIAADADRSRLSDATLCQLMHGFISQRAGARHDPDRTFLVYRSRHNADLALAGRDNPGTVWPNQPRAPVLQKLPSLDHVERRNAFSDADDEIKFGVGCFHDGIGGERRRNENHRRVGPGLLDGLLHGVENRPAFMHGAAFARRYSAHHLRSVSRAGLGV